MDFKSMTDSELANVMVNYICRVSHLAELIANHLDGKDCGAMPAVHISNEYKNLKNELREDAKYLNLVRNRKGSKLYMFCFAPSVREAAASGFSVNSNGMVDHSMLYAVSEAEYKLTKYYSLEEWGSLI